MSDVMTPMRAQMTASDPALSVWVSANAGTGKTKVLTDRVLRLLLAGTAPSRILCITYTKAAAAEMENRIHKTLSDWVAMEDGKLAAALRSLTNEAADEKALQRARSLFATVLDAPEGVRILTIHSFCQSLLRRFPLEAGVQPHFEVIDERNALELVAEARQRLFSRSLQAEDTDIWLREAITLLAERLAESQFQELLGRLISARRHLVPALDRPCGAIRLITQAYAALDMPYGQTEQALFAEHFAYSKSQEFALRDAIKLLFDGSKTDIEKAEAMCPWWQDTGAGRMAPWPQYREAWLTQKGTPRKALATVKVLRSNPSVEDVLREEAERVLHYEARIRALRNAQFTAAAVNVVDGLLSIYNYLKASHQFLDYDDLVLLTLRLLQRPGIAPWVLYKLDGGLDHVLIDEAQDTSPEQWALVDSLVEEFFAGEGRNAERTRPRTLFVVGDEKQSIYSFQGAAPKAFGAKSDEFSARAEAAKVAFQKVSLGVSFRSTDAVLQVVDAVISQPQVQSGMSFQDGIVPHEAFRTGQAGLVEVWPPVQGDEREERDIWEVQQAPVVALDSQFILAERIAKAVRGWLDSGEMLESQARPIRAGDILVLVRSRNSFMHHLVRALKRLQVPVAGADRLMLTENIAVMDMLALAEFLLLPEDDLSLACLLKSPLCAVSEEQLFALAHGRGKASLWSRVQADNAMKPVTAFLRGMLERVDYIRPYELFASVLEEQGGRGRFAARLGDEVFDPLDEFLALALDYERSHAPSLQGFLNWVRTGDTQIKRDMEQGQDAVRIMTVHGAKGLQAPVVFMPDTIPSSGGNRLPPMLWTEHGGEPVMLWSPSAAEDDAVTGALRDAYKQAEDEESRRLLYVAMTRAEDRLYICGALGRKSDKIPESSWYNWITSGVEGLMESVPLTFAPVQPDGEPETVEVLRLQTTQRAVPREGRHSAARATAAAMPDYLQQPPAPEPYPPQPLVPSRSDDEQAMIASSSAAPVLSPVHEGERFLRGNLIHRLLQWLPDTAEDARATAAEAYLSRYAADMSEAERDGLVEEVLAVLAAPEMAPVFAAGSLAEVPVSGLIDMAGEAAPRILSGQIDRLRVTDEAVWIVDYKTQRQPPANPEDVPEAYLRQMAVYRAALLRIYPDRPVYSALLWTAAPALMVLPEALLRSPLDSAPV